MSEYEGVFEDLFLMNLGRYASIFRALESFEANDQEAVITILDAIIVKNKVGGALKPLGNQGR